MRVHTRRLVPAFFALLLTAALLPAVSAQAAVLVKAGYEASFRCVSEQLGHCENVGKSDVAIGQRELATFALTVTNTTTSRLGPRLFALDIEVPQEFQPASLNRPPHGLSWERHDGNVRLIWPVGLAPGKSSTVEIEATAPALVDEDGRPSDVEVTKAWGTETPWWHIAFSGIDPQTIATAGPPAQLAFEQQPTDTQIEVAMAPHVTVRVEDERGSLVKRYNSNQEREEGVSLAYGFTTTIESPSGERADVEGGTATFDDLAFPVAASNLNLRATAMYGETPLREAGSDAFNVWQRMADCPETSCTSDTVSTTTPGGTTKAKVDAGPGDAATIGVTVGDASFGYVEGCTDSALFDAGAKGVTFDVTGKREKTVTYTLSKSLVQVATKRGSPHFGICFMVPKDQGQPFMAITQDGTLQKTEAEEITVGSGDMWMYVGLLPGCKTKGIIPGQPCLVSDNGVAGGGREFLIRTPPGDPRITS